MNQEDNFRERMVRLWFAKAEEDLQVLGVLESFLPAYASVICFHAQQAIEKCMKAFLIRHRQEVPKTHELIELAKRVEAIAPDLAASLSPCFMLSKYAVTGRYPEELDSPVPDAIEAAEAIRLARMVAHLVQKNL
jgi:HEPN domain-containing protein